MPNHVLNKLHFIGEEEKVREALEKLKYDEKGIGSIDFNKIIPMPEILKTMRTDIHMHKSINAYLSVINPWTINSYRNKNIPNFSEDHFNEIVIKVVPFNRYLRLDLSEEEIDQLAEQLRYKNAQDLIAYGHKCISNILLYNAPTWYEWAYMYWGTKWNAYECEGIIEENTIMFKTAWANVTTLMIQMSRQFPDIEFEYQFAEEFIGTQVGSYNIKDGDVLSYYRPADGSLDAVNMALEIWGMDPLEGELETAKICDIIDKMKSIFNGGYIDFDKCRKLDIKDQIDLVRDEALKNYHK